MSVEIKGLIEVVDYLDSKMEQSKSNKPLEDASKLVLETEVEVAHRLMHKKSTGIGADALKSFPVRMVRNGSRIQSTGIRGRQTMTDKKREKQAVENGEERATYWKKVCGIWFQNYGYYNHRGGAYVPGNHWMDVAYEESVEDAYRIIVDGLNELWD